jgi:hypothetical protein
VFRLLNHRGWASKEFITGRVSGDTSIRDAFFAAHERTGLSHVGVVDLIVEALMEHLRERDSWFAQPDFPYAETWWWSMSAVEVKDDWLLAFLSGLGAGEAGTTLPLCSPPS